MTSETAILEGRLVARGPVWALGATAEDLLAAAPVAIGLHGAGRLAGLALRDGGSPGPVDPGEASWAGAMAEWWRAEAVTLTRDAPPAGAARMVLGGAALLDPEDDAARAWLADVRAADPRAVAAVGALGAEAARGVDPARARDRLTRLAAEGALLHVEPVLRFAPPGRGFVELVENIQHRSGPGGQSVVADTLRAALFGRFGAVPVNLGARERPPVLDVTSLLVFYVSVEELLR